MLLPHLAASYENHPESVTFCYPRAIHELPHEDALKQVPGKLGSANWGPGKLRSESIFRANKCGFASAIPRNFLARTRKQGPQNRRLLAPIAHSEVARLVAFEPIFVFHHVMSSLLIS